jgi:autotransporter-associated beta strand protein
MKKLLKTATLGLIASVALGVYGATNYWDNNGSAAGFGAASGIWGIDSNWSTDNLGTVVPTVTATTASDDLFFGYGTNGLAAGTVAVEGTNQSFRTMTFGAASGHIALEGGEIRLAAPVSAVKVDNISNTVSTVLTGTDGLQLTKTPELISETFLSESDSTIFTNAALVSYRSAGAIMNGGWIAKIPANVYHFENDGAIAAGQFQSYHDGYTKCVKVIFTQVGGDIAARCSYAKNVIGNQLGRNFDEPGANDALIATSPSVNGYGIARSSLLPAPDHYEPFLTAAPVTILANAALSDYHGISASMAGTSVSGQPVPTTPLFFENNGATATVQFQSVNGGWTKCVAVKLAQSGADITAQVLYARYISTSSPIGTDFDKPGTLANTIATGFGVGGYGVFAIRLDRGNILQLSAVNTWSGSTFIDGGRLAVANAGQLGSGAYSGTITNNACLFYNSAASQTLSGAIKGSGRLIKASPGKSVSSLTYPSTLGDSFSDIFYNASLADCTGAEGVLGGPSIGGGIPMPAATYFFENDGTNATCQFQVYDGGHTKCAKVAFTQNGPNIAARRVYAKYLLSQNSLGFDFDTGGSIGGYLVVQTTVDLLRHSILKLSGSNSYAGGTVVEKGTLEVNGTTSSLPTSGGIVVNEDAELLLNVPGDPGITASVGGNNPIYVNGGILTINGKFNAGHQRPIIVDGGVLNSTVTANNDNSNYMNNLTLMNGASITGYKIRVGYVSAATITVAGTNACSIPAGINMVKDASGNYALTFNVADVTGNSDPDLTIPGVIRDYTGSQYEYMPIIKTGAGTISFSNVNTHKGVITISQGALALDGDNTLNANNSIVLNGGTLAMGDFANTVGTLTVGAAGGTLALGTDALSFADSSALSWSGTLSLTGTLIEKSVRFGTDNTGLTLDQLNAIEYLDGINVRLNPDGYLTVGPQGTVILIQ